MSELLVEQVDYRLTPEGYEPSRPETLRGQIVPEIDETDLAATLTAANDHYKVFRDGRGCRHETLLFNADKIGNGLVFKPTTSFSSALKNPANVLETGLSATMNPEVAFLMWGSWGNHPTGHMDASDRSYVRRTGRHTEGNGSLQQPYRALDPYKYLLEALELEGYMPTHFIADQEAGRLVLPMMTEMQRNRVKGVYLNGIDGVSPKANYVTSSVAEDAKSRIKRRGMGDGKPGEVTPANIKNLKELMPAIYSGIGRVAHLAPLPVFLFPLDVRDKIGVTIGYRGHKDLDNLPDHAVYQDLRAAMLNQNAPVTMQFNRESPQHHVEDCIELGRLVMNSIPENVRTDNRTVRLLLGTGGLSSNTEKPYEAARIHRLSFPDIMRFMGVRALRQTLPSQKAAA